LILLWLISLGLCKWAATAIFNIDKITANADLFFERINTYKGTYWNSTPSFISVYLANKNFNQSYFTKHYTVCFIGRRFTCNTRKRIKATFP
jgi:hypothetical protein